MTDDAVLTLIVLAPGPDFHVEQALETASAMAGGLNAEVVVVSDRPTAREDESISSWVAAQGHVGNALNTAVSASTAPLFAIIEPDTRVPGDYLTQALQLLARDHSAAFAACTGPALRPDSRPDEVIDLGFLLGGAWMAATPVIRRTAFDAAGGFDPDASVLCVWELLIRLTDGAAHGSPIAFLPPDGEDRLPGSHWRRPDRYLPAVRYVFEKHRQSFDAHVDRVLTDRDGLAARLWRRERDLIERRERAQQELAETMEALSSRQQALAAIGRATLEWEDLRRTTPLSRNWGMERGRPIDRHYIEAFIARHAGDIRGAVLEMLDPGLTLRFGGSRVTRPDVLDIDPANDRATIVADLRGGDLPEELYDCFILTQTLHLIDDIDAAVENAVRVLKPGGVLLVTLPALSMVAVEYGRSGDHWRVTEAGARRLFSRHFREADLTITSHGNVLAATAFLYGLSCEELTPEELDARDPAYPVIVTVRAVKRRRHTARTKPVQEAAVLLYHRVASPARDVHELAVAPERFREQMQYLAAEWHPMRLTDVVEGLGRRSLPPRAVAVTFDDGYLDNLETAAPILQESGIPATFFLTTEEGAEPRQYWWDVLEETLLGDTELPPTVTIRFGGTSQTFVTRDAVSRRETHDALHAIVHGSEPVVRDCILRQLRMSSRVALPAGPRRLAAAEVRSLAVLPGVDIGAHGVYHLALPKVSRESCFREVFESRSALERIAGVRVTSFAYPFGDVSPAAIAAVRSAGFAAACVCGQRVARYDDDRLAIPRIQAPNAGRDQLDALLMNGSAC